MKTILIISVLFLLSNLLVSAQKQIAGNTSQVPDTIKTQVPDTDSDIKKILSAEEYKDYQAWVSLGIGGLPHTLEGYRTVKRMGAMMKDPVDLSRISPYIGKNGDLATLKELPKRSGTKPSIAPFAVPHRQTDQHNSEQVRKTQTGFFDAAVAGSHSKLIYKNSYLENTVPAFSWPIPIKVTRLLLVSPMQKLAISMLSMALCT